MRLVTFARDGVNRIGTLVNDGALVDLTEAGLPADMNAFIALGEAGLARGREAVDGGGGRVDPASVTMLAPIPRPLRNVVCVGKNYHEHAQEFHGSGFDSTGKEAVPLFPVIFTKAPSSVVGPGAAIELANDYSNTTDYEGELGVVIGTGGKNIAPERAYDHVYGYTVINDVSARTIQHQHNQWFLGKSPDTYCPMGPALTTADEIGDVTELHLVTTVNGEIRQDAYVRDLIFDIPTLIATISRTMTLEVADVIATGTPAGVGIGFNPPVYLKAGDTVAVEIDRIGKLENPVT